MFNQILSIKLASPANKETFHFSGALFVERQKKNFGAKSKKIRTCTPNAKKSIGKEERGSLKTHHISSDNILASEDNG